MKLNNKGFAITTILYGALILFLMLFLSLLGILSQYRKNLEKLEEASNGARSIVTMSKNNAKETTLGSEVDSFGFYKINENGTIKCYRYLSSKTTANCE